MAPLEAPQRTRHVQKTRDGRWLGKGEKVGNGGCAGRPPGGSACKAQT